MYYVGVDVGSRSVRAALVNSNGQIISTSSSKVNVYEPKPDFYEQSSDNIWEACCESVKNVTRNVDDKKLIRGIGFDATCSLVALDSNMMAVSVSPTSETCRSKDVPVMNVIMWMDHRAKEEADFINDTKHPMLRFVGGKISPEMQPPKLLWLKENLHDSCWKNASYFMDLPDFMTWKATGALTRSLCSMVCKWLYASDEVNQGKPVDSFWQEIGLADLVEDGYSKIGYNILSPGQPCGNGLTIAAADELGLCPHTSVATSIIDAHAGTIGLLSSNIDSEPLTSRLAIIAGTSSCHMALNKSALFVPGVWGPYYSALLPGFWLNEGGQSASGELIDHILRTHPSYPEVLTSARYEESHVQDKLNEILESMGERLGLSSASTLVHDLHVLPDFHGNRSPLADSNLKGMICGLTLDVGDEQLALLYLASIHGIAYGTRHIIEVLEGNGHGAFSSILMCGGLSKNNLFVQVHADITGLPIYLPDEIEPTLLGSAILAATASGDFRNEIDTLKMMSRFGGNVIKIIPKSADQRFHEMKYKVFKKMYEDQKDYVKIMSVV